MLIVSIFLSISVNMLYFPPFALSSASVFLHCLFSLKIVDYLLIKNSSTYLDLGRFNVSSTSRCTSRYIELEPFVTSKNMKKIHINMGPKMRSNTSGNFLLVNVTFHDTFVGSKTPFNMSTWLSINVR